MERNETTERSQAGREEMHDLMNYETGEYIREATAAELAESVEAAEGDGGAGVIEVDDVRCYVQD